MITNVDERDYHMYEPEDVGSYLRDFDLTDSIETRIEVLKILEYRRRTDIILDNGDILGEKISKLERALEIVGDDIREAAGNS